jgi:hypothetical protein
MRAARRVGVMMEDSPKAKQYSDPIRIVAFNTSEGWSRDVSEDIAREIQARAEREQLKLSEGLRGWIDWQIGLAGRAKQVARDS